MAYCDTGDVESLTGMRFGASTMPTATEAGEIVDNISAEIDGVAQAAGYTVPVTATTAAAMLKRYNTLGAACECWHHGFRSESANPPNAEYWCVSYRDFLTRLKKGEQQLPGLTPTGQDDPVFAIRPQIPRDWLTTQERLDQ